MKLDYKQKHLLRLVIQKADPEGWAKVSSIVMPLIEELPRELAEVRKTESGGLVKLTDAGKAVVAWA